MNPNAFPRVETTTAQIAQATLLAALVMQQATESALTTDRTPLQVEDVYLAFVNVMDETLPHEHVRLRTQNNLAMLGFGW